MESKKIGLVALPLDLSWKKDEDPNYLEQEEEYLGLYTTIKVNTTWENMDEEAINGTDTLDRFNVALVAFTDILEKEGHQIKYLSAPETISKDVLDYVGAEKPDIIFFGCSHSSSYTLMEKLSQKIKEVSPNTLVVAGGQYVAGTRRVPPAVDILVKGGGFAPVYYISAANREELENTKGMITKADIPEKYRTEFDSKYEAFPYENLNHLDFDYLPASRIYFQNGCLPPDGTYVQCGFCGSVNVKRHRIARDIGRVLETIDEMVHKFGSQHIFIGEEDFLAVRGAAEKVVSALEKWRGRNQDANVTFSSQVRVENAILHADLLPRLAAVGMTEMQIGAESVSQKVVDAFGGKHEVENIETALRTIRNSGMGTLAHFLVGLPEETIESLHEMRSSILRWIETDILCLPEIRYPVYYPGTRFGNRPEKYGLTLIESDPKKLVAERGSPTFLHKNISQKQMSQEMKEFFKEINARFRKKIAANPQWRKGPKRPTPY